MVNVLGIAGSLRKGSFNRCLLRAAVDLAPESCKIEIATIDEVPLYNGDVETSEGPPPGVRALKQKFMAADGVLLVTPEYNNSVPGVFKNTIDWLSRPPAESAAVFMDRPVGLIGATPGNGGTRLSQAAWLPVLRTLGVQVFSRKGVFVSGAEKIFDVANGTITDDKTREVVRNYLKAFAEFVNNSAKSKGAAAGVIAIAQ